MLQQTLFRRRCPGIHQYQKNLKNDQQAGKQNAQANRYIGRKKADDGNEHHHSGKNPDRVIRKFHTIGFFRALFNAQQRSALKVLQSSAPGYSMHRPYEKISAEDLRLQIL